LGARPPVTAIWIAIELKLAKPHSAKVTIATLRGLRCSFHVAEVDEGDELVQDHLGPEQAAASPPRSRDADQIHDRLEDVAD
jgi:hypothetical protein